MAIVLGKRKRRSQLDEEPAETDIQSGGAHDGDPQTLFKKHFEASFEPLPDTQPIPVLTGGDANETKDGDSSSDWGGLSDESEPAIKLIQHNESRTARPEMTKAEYKKFMTSKPPSAAESIPSKSKQKLPTDPDASTEATNLKNDLALQRLLKESHLLSPSDPSSTLLHSGVNRHKALDLRLQDMGSKTSIFKQEKMPLAQRRGIAAKAKEREESRRKEAFENGIVIERIKAKKPSVKPRERGVGRPAVGKFQGGTLKLSRKDVAKIEGPRKKTLGGLGGKRSRR